MWEAEGKKIILRSSVCAEFSQLMTLVKEVSFLLVEGRHHSHGGVYLQPSRSEGEIRMLFLYLLFVQAPLAHNNCYAKVAYFGLANSAKLKG